MRTADRAQTGQRLRHGRRRVAMHRGDQLGPVLLDRLFDLLEGKDRAPFRLDGAHVGAAAARDLAQQMAEAAVDRHQHHVARHDQGGHAGLDAGARRAVDQERPMVLRLKDLPIEGHDLVHVRGEGGIELAQQRHRHGAGDARVGIDRTGTHHQAGRRIEIVEGITHGFGLS